MLPMKEKQSLQTAERVLEILQRHGNSPLAPGQEHESRWLHIAKIAAAVRAERTIHLVLPAFPAKSPNPQKTLGSNPDLAELLGLQRLQQTCEAIQAIYAPGARVTICSDGRVFSDLVLVSDEAVSAYRNEIEGMIREHALSALATFNMEDLFSTLTFGEMRRLLTERYARPVTEIRAETKATAAAAAMFNGIHRFLFEDRVVLESGKSRNRVREETKTLAYQVIQRSNAWSALVEEQFPEAVRLSIHPQFPDSPKLGFQLVDCQNAWGTPWHNVALEERPGFFRLVKRAEAESRGATLALAHGKYAFFRVAQ